MPRNGSGWGNRWQMEPANDHPELHRRYVENELLVSPQATGI